MKHEYSTIALFAVLFVGAIISSSTATDTGIWNDETVNNTITQTVNTDNVCLGEICYLGWTLSIEGNASIDNSEICTVGNGLCASTTNVSGNLTPIGTEGNIQYKNGSTFGGTNDLNWTGDYLDIGGTGTALNLAYGDSTNPSLTIGNSSIGIYASDHYNILFKTNNQIKWLMSQSGIQAFTGGSGAVAFLAEDATTTNPVLVSLSDFTTGIGFGSSGSTLNLIEDGKNIVQIEEGEVTIITETDITTDSIGEQALTLNAKAGQIATIMDVKDSAANVVWSIDKDGNTTFANGGKIYDNSTCVIIESPGGTKHSFCN